MTSSLGTGDRVGTLAPQMLEDGTTIPIGAAGTIVGWRGEELIVEWRTGDGEIVVGYLAPGLVRLYGRRGKATVPTVDTNWCALRGRNVPTTECADSCGAPEMRPSCWAGRMAPGMEA